MGVPKKPKSLPLEHCGSQFAKGVYADMLCFHQTSPLLSNQTLGIMFFLERRGSFSLFHSKSVFFLIALS